MNFEMLIFFFVIWGKRPQPGRREVVVGGNGGCCCGVDMIYLELEQQQKFKKKYKKAVFGMPKIIYPCRDPYITFHC